MDKLGLKTLQNRRDALPLQHKDHHPNSQHPAQYQQPVPRRIRVRTTTRFGASFFFAVAALLLLLLHYPTFTGTGLFFAPPPVHKISEKHDAVFAAGCRDPEIERRQPRANAAFVVLTQNKDLEGVIQSVKSIERHFNRWFHYPYVFLNDADFNITFKNTIQNYTSSRCEFGRIDSDHWGFPEWADADDAKDAIRKQGEAGIMYGGLESYHHMCRFYSGFFYKHKLLQKYDWYWRIEPEIKYFCDITYDPFLLMERTNKTYGFTIAAKEFQNTVPNLFRYVSAYRRINNITSKGLWEMFLEPREGFNQDGSHKHHYGHGHAHHTVNLTDPGQSDLDLDSINGESYNLCHFWSNFEIGRLEWFRSEQYENFFRFLDRTGGFWKERWGDAPVHSLAAGALLSPSDIHYFRDFGYRHTTIQHCPANAPDRQMLRDPYFDESTPEKMRKKEDDYWAHWDPPRENGVGCRCRCDTDVGEVENKDWSCMSQWIDIAGGYVPPGRAP